MNELFTEPHARHFVYFPVCLGFLILLNAEAALFARQDVGVKQNVWPELAPGETTANPGTKLLPNPKDPSITRIKDITQPTLEVYPAKEPNGTAMLVLPGGGFTYVVPDLEGSEAAPFFNNLGVSLFVLKYRTGDNKKPRVWRKPVQDAQRSIRWIRANADQWGVESDKVGVLGFSAGGQAATFLLTADKPLYEPNDQVDEYDFRPSFGVLVYAWRLLDENSNLKEGINVMEDTPKTIIIHTHDDPASDSLGAIRLYSALKESKVDAEMHIYRTGGHGYGIRKKVGSVIHKWPSVVHDWLEAVVFEAGP